MISVALSHATEGDIADATDLIAAAVADGYEVHLFQSGFSPTEATTAAEFAAAEADFTGYASKSIGGVGFLFVGPMTDSDDKVVFATPGMNWIATDAVTPNLIGGLWVENTAGDVRRYVQFPSPMPMNEALQFLNVTIYESPGNPGYVVVEN